MSNYATLKAAIAEVIKTNGNNAITGSILQSSLLSMVDSLGAGYQFAGIATPTTNPGTPDQNVFYITAIPGVYSNFASANVTGIGVLSYNGTWNFSAIYSVDDSPMPQSESLVKSGGVNARLYENWFVGANDTFQRVRIDGLFPGKTYRLFVINPNYDRSGITIAPGQASLFRCVNYYGGEAQEPYLVNVSIGGTVQEYYDITIPENSDYIEVCGRATMGVRVRFSIVYSDFILSYDNRVFDNFLVGNNNTIAAQRIDGLRPGNTYLLYVKNPNYDKSGITYGAGSAGLFQIVNVYNNNRDYIGARSLIGDIVLPCYEFTIPNNSDYIVIEGRATLRTKIEFVLVDITNTKSGLELNVICNYGVNRQGEKIQDENLCCTKTVVPVTPGQKLAWVVGATGYDSSKCALVFYDSSINVLTYFSGNDIVRYITVPAGASYMDATFYMGADNTGVFAQDGTAIFKPSFPNKKGLLVQLDHQINDVGNVYKNKGYDTDGNIVDLNISCCTKSPVLVTEGQTIIWACGTFPEEYREKGRLVLLDSNGTAVGYYSPYAEQRVITIPSGVVSVNASFLLSKQGAGIYDNSNEPIFVPISDGIVEEIKQINEKLDSVGDIYERNIDRTAMLTAACRYRKYGSTSKDFQMMLVADSHDDPGVVKNAIVGTNKFRRIDAMIHLGDVVNQIELGEDVQRYWKSLLMQATKPTFFVMGNHEKGVYRSIYLNPSNDVLYNGFIKPLVDSGFLVSGEYTANKCYYYHDFTQRQVRLIVVDEYETPLIIDETYWEKIAYDSSLTEYGIVNNADFTQGQKINVKNFTQYSFQARENITGANFYNGKVPSYKYGQGSRWMSQQQCQWFLDTLASTPENYLIIVACHNPFSEIAVTQPDKMFCQNFDSVGSQQSGDVYMVNDFFADAINAYVNKSNYAPTITSTQPSDMPSFSVSKNFASVVGKFHSFIGGHAHKDLIWKHPNYNQYQISPIDANSNYYAQNVNADIRRSDIDHGNVYDVDCLTVESFAENRIGLVKIGVNVTETGEKRDYEILDIS